MIQLAQYRPKKEIITLAASTARTPHVIDVHKQVRAKNLDAIDLKKKRPFKVHANYGDSAPIQQKLDINTWLPFASKHYDISADIMDYIFVPVFIVISDLPNRNGIGFPRKSLIEFRPDFGVQAYKTAKGKCVFYEHANQDITKSRGTIADAFLRSLNGYQGGLLKYNQLLAVDRTKDEEYTKRILTSEHNTYSMGAYVDEYSCSYCGAKLGQCNHIKKNRLDFYEKDGMLVFKNVHGLTFFECSSVAVPAYAMAISDIILQ